MCQNNKKQEVVGILMEETVHSRSALTWKSINMEPVSRAKFIGFFASMRADGPKAHEFAWLDYAHFDGLLRRCVPMAAEGEKPLSPESVEGKQSSGLWSAPKAMDPLSKKQNSPTPMRQAGDDPCARQAMTVRSTHELPLPNPASDLCSWYGCFHVRLPSI